MTHSIPTPSSPTDEQLLSARDEWTSAKWATHFERLGVKPAGAARYSTSGNNDVLKQALSDEFHNRCWYQGSADCHSRAILLRNAQIDHIVQQKAPPATLRRAAGSSSYQSEVFDVHDPGNLALICGPCNLERGTKSHLTPAMQDRRVASEAARDSLIKRVEKWHRDSKIDRAALTALAGTDVSDDETWEVMSSMITGLIERRAGSDFSFESSVEVQSTQFKFNVEPSDQVVEEYAEWYAENAAEEIRIEQRYERLGGGEDD